MSRKSKYSNSSYLSSEMLNLLLISPQVLTCLCHRPSQSTGAPSRSEEAAKDSTGGGGIAGGGRLGRGGGGGVVHPRGLTGSVGGGRDLVVREDKCSSNIFHINS